MEEKNMQETKLTFGGFLTNQKLPGKLRGGAKGLLILCGVLILIFTISLLVQLGFAGIILAMLYMGLYALCFLPLVWLLYAAADILEKTTENNEFLRKLSPEHIPQQSDMESPTE